MYVWVGLPSDELFPFLRADDRRCNKAGDTENNDDYDEKDKDEDGGSSGDNGHDCDPDDGDDNDDSSHKNNDVVVVAVTGHDGDNAHDDDHSGVKGLFQSLILSLSPCS